MVFFSASVYILYIYIIIFFFYTLIYKKTHTYYKLVELLGLGSVFKTFKKKLKFQTSCGLFNVKYYNTNKHKPAMKSVMKTQVPSNVQPEEFLVPESRAEIFTNFAFHFLSEYARPMMWGFDGCSEETRKSFKSKQKKVREFFHKDANWATTMNQMETIGNGFVLCGEDSEYMGQFIFDHLDEEGAWGEDDEEGGISEYRFASTASSAMVNGYWTIYNNDYDYMEDEDYEERVNKYGSSANKQDAWRRHIHLEHMEQWLKEKLPEEHWQFLEAGKYTHADAYAKTIANIYLVHPENRKEIFDRISGLLGSKKETFMGHEKYLSDFDKRRYEHPNHSPAYIFPDTGPVWVSNEKYDSDLAQAKKTIEKFQAIFRGRCVRWRYPLHMLIIS